MFENTLRCDFLRLLESVFQRVWVHYLLQSLDHNFIFEVFQYQVDAVKSYIES